MWTGFTAQVTLNRLHTEESFALFPIWESLKSSQGAENRGMSTDTPPPLIALAASSRHKSRPTGPPAIIATPLHQLRVSRSVDLDDKQTWNAELWEVEWWSWTELGRAHITSRIRAALELEHAPPRARVKLPRLKAESVDRYIAAVSVAIAEGKLEPAEGRALLYSAQLVITAQRSGAVQATKPKPSTKPKA